MATNSIDSKHANDAEEVGQSDVHEEAYSLETKDVAILKLDFVLHQFNIVLRHKNREAPLKSLMKIQFDKMQVEADINAKKVRLQGHLHHLMIQNLIDWTPGNLFLVSRHSYLP